MLQFISNFILGLVLVLTPGPTVIALLNITLKRGLKKSVLLASGIMLSELVCFCIVYFGLSAIINTRFSQIILGTLGGLFLIYLGITNIITSSKEITKNDFSDKNPFYTGFMINMFNPMSIAMWIGIITAAIAINRNFFIVSGILWGILGAYIIFILLVYFIKNILNKKTIKILAITTGIFLILYGLNLFWQMMAK